MIEYEKKYLVKELPEDLELYQKSEIMQGYLSNNPDMRIRQYKQENDEMFYVLTIKVKNGLYRDETEFQINQEQFNNLVPLVQSKWIEKTRYYIPLADLLEAELDIYYDELSGLQTVEVEFLNEVEANEFIPPVWFGEDVTFDKKYKNASLAFGGL